MGIDMFAVGDDEVLLNKTFFDVGLDSNFRHCQVANWEDVVTYCLDLDNFSDICWAQHSPDVVKSWLQLSKKRILHATSCNFDTDKFIKFMEICVVLNASLFVF